MRKRYDKSNQPIQVALRVAASLEHCSIANMIEVLIRDHCKQRGIAIPASGEIETENNNGACS